MATMRFTNPVAWVFDNAGDMSKTSNTSAATLDGVGDIRHVRFVMPYLVWTGTSPVGSAQLEVSPDNINWFNIGSAVAVSGNTGKYSWDVIDTGALWVRVVYTKTSGTGTLTGGYSAKGF